MQELEPENAKLKRLVAELSLEKQLEAISLREKITGKQLRWKYVEENRRGDHIWWISDLTHFQEHYPNWHLQYNVSSDLAGNL
jgi:hypothetical protein